MAHHYNDPNEVPPFLTDNIQTEMNRQRQAVYERFKAGIPRVEDEDVMMLEPLGATGRHPEGKLSEHDAGEFRYSCAADPKTKTVLLNFGTPVSLAGLTKEQAVEMATLLLDAAASLRLVK